MHFGNAKSWHHERMEFDLVASSTAIAKHFANSALQVFGIYVVVEIFLAKIMSRVGTPDERGVSMNWDAGWHSRGITQHWALDAPDSCCCQYFIYKKNKKSHVSTRLHFLEVSGTNKSPSLH